MLTGLKPSGNRSHDGINVRLFGGVCSTAYRKIPFKSPPPSSTFFTVSHAPHLICHICCQSGLFVVLHLGDVLLLSSLL